MIGFKSHARLQPTICRTIGNQIKDSLSAQKRKRPFDLFYASKHTDLNLDRIIQFYWKYMKLVESKPPTVKEFFNNLKLKQSPPFRDIGRNIKRGNRI